MHSSLSDTKKTMITTNWLSALWRYVANWRVRTKLALAFLGLSLSSLAILAYLNARFVQMALTNEAARGLQVAAIRTVDNLNQFMALNLEKIQSEAQMPFIQDYLLLPKEKRPLSVEQMETIRMLRFFKNTSQWFLSYALLDQDGNVILDTNSLNVGLNEANQDYFHIPFQQNTPYLSPIRMWPAETPVFYVSAPISGRFKNQMLGVLRVRYDANVFQTLVAQQNGLLGEGSFAILLDEHDTYLAHGIAPAKRFKPVAGLDRRLAEALQQHQALFTYQDETHAIYQIARLPLKEQGWFVAFFQPHNTFLGAARAHRDTSVWLIIIMAGLVSVAAIAVANLLTQPIITLTRVAEEVATGNLHAKVDLHSQDEIGVLAATFNSMTTQLQDLFEQTQRAKEKAETANQAKSMFLANMSHELRTPLNAILGFAQIISRSHTLAPEDQEYLGIINRSGEHLLSLINQVLDLSKIEAGKMRLDETAFDLYRLLDDLKDMFQWRAAHKALQLVFDRADDVPRYIRTDEVKLRQVLMNLLTNAIKFTKEGGVAVRVSYRNGEMGNTSPQLPNSPSPHLRFEIEDTGPGVAPEELNTLFEAFVQTKAGREVQEGTGLGLTISHKFVQSMGGDLSVRSEVGRGTTFTFEIRASVVAATDMKSKLPSRRVIALEPDQPRYRLLIVDDQPDNRKLLVKFLNPYGPSTGSGQGFELREAANGQEAIDIWEQWEPHLIWMDLRMPVMGGYEATKRIRNEELGMRNEHLSETPPTIHHPRTVIIALSASSFDEERTVALTQDCDDFLRKPFRETDLFEMLCKHLGVRFVYEEGEWQKAKSEGQGDQDVLTLTALAGLPQKLLADLEYAVTTTDITKIVALLAEIQQHDPALANALRKLVEQFDYIKILTMLQKATY